MDSLGSSRLELRGSQDYSPFLASELFLLIGISIPQSLVGQDCQLLLHFMSSFSDTQWKGLTSLSVAVPRSGRILIDYLGWVPTAGQWAMPRPHEPPICSLWLVAVCTWESWAGKDRRRHGGTGDSSLKWRLLLNWQNHRAITFLYWNWNYENMLLSASESDIFFLMV